MINYLDGNVVMNSDQLGAKLADFSRLHLQPVRRIHITVEVLDKNDSIIDVLQGISTGGNLSIDAKSFIRRTGSLSFVLFDKLLPNSKSLLWMTNKIRIYAGIDDLNAKDATATHFCLGTFYITEPSVTVNKDNRSISISLQDRMGRWEDEEFENRVLIPAGIKVSEGLKSLLTLVGETELSLIEDTGDLTVPYDVEFAQGSNVLDALQKLVGLYMDWECFYDTEGKFVFRKMTFIYDREVTPEFVFEEHSPLVIAFNENFTYKAVKNRIVVFGAMDNVTGIVPRSQADLAEDANFGANNIGIKKKVLVEQSLTTKEQCQAKAEYELFKASNLQETGTITSIPIYFLDANHVIEVYNNATGETEKFVIDAITFGLLPSEFAQIQVHKLYYDDIIIDTHDEKIDYICDRIINKGWLSTPEMRIRDYYGLQGNGTKLILNFEYNAIGGTTAYTTGYFGTTSQTLTVDLVDLGNATDDNGDNHTNKGDYSDRIIGHEMVHAVMNSAMGMAKTSGLPEWFKEGSAEFIHGADERLKISILEDEEINDAMLQYVINRAVSLLNGNGWLADSNEYSASYLIMKYIDKKIVVGKDMKSFMASVKDSPSDGLNAVKEAIVANTAFATFDDFINDFKDNAMNYVKTQVTLNPIGDEVDTGSIGGSDHRGTASLTAEDIFDESQATEGLVSIGFEVELPSGILPWNPPDRAIGDAIIEQDFMVY